MLGGIVDDGPDAAAAALEPSKYIRLVEVVRENINRKLSIVGDLVEKAEDQFVGLESEPTVDIAWQLRERQPLCRIGGNDGWVVAELIRISLGRREIASEADFKVIVISDTVQGNRQIGDLVAAAERAGGIHVHLGDAIEIGAVRWVIR